MKNYAEIIFPTAWSCKSQRVLHTRDASSHINVARRLIISRIPMKIIIEDHDLDKSGRIKDDDASKSGITKDDIFLYLKKKVNHWLSNFKK
jgi:hypothetical protein